VRRRSSNCASPRSRQLHIDVLTGDICKWLAGPREVAFDAWGLLNDLRDGACQPRRRSCNTLSHCCTAVCATGEFRPVKPLLIMAKSFEASRVAMTRTRSFERLIHGLDECAGR
jgi:hypothetical protein